MLNKETNNPKYKDSFVETLRNGLILADGAMGTYLQEQTVSNSPIIIEELSLTHPQEVRSAHIEYIQSGSSLIQTNTFAANREKLGELRLQDEVKNINEAAVGIAKEAIKLTGQDIWIAGSVGPTGKTLQPIGTYNLNHAKKTYYEQVSILADAGVDLIVLETFTDVKEISAAIEAINEIGLLFIAQMSFGTEGKTATGTSPIDAAMYLEQMGASAVGSNCSVGSSPMIKMIAEMSSKVTIPIIAQPNAGFPTQEGGRTVYRSSPNYMAQQALRLIENGATLIGGCCGTGPKHIEALRDIIKDGTVRNAIKDNPRLHSYNNRSNPITVIKDAELSGLAKKIKAGIRVLTMEIDPPTGFRASVEIDKLKLIRSSGIVDALNIADNPRAQRRMSPLAMSTLIQTQLGIETIMHVALRNRNYASLHSDLMGAHALGIQNIFTVMGDKSPGSSNSSTPELPNLTTTSALKLMKEFNRGYDLSGNTLEAKSAFFKGAAFNPSPKNLDREVRVLESKIEAGADFLLTQPVYSSEGVIKFANILGGFPIPVLIGILPLRSKRNAEFLENEVPGISIPANVMSSISTSANPRETGIKICQDVSEELRDISAGVYYMAPFGRYDTIIEFAENFR